MPVNTSFIWCTQFDLHMYKWRCFFSFLLGLGFCHCSLQFAFLCVCCAFGDISFFGDICFLDVPFHFSLGLVFGIWMLLKGNSRLLQLGDRTCSWVTVAVQAGHQKLPAATPPGHSMYACALPPRVEGVKPWEPQERAGFCHTFRSTLGLLVASVSAGLCSLPPTHLLRCGWGRSMWAGASTKFKALLGEEILQHHDRERTCTFFVSLVNAGDRKSVV